MSRFYLYPVFMMGLAGGMYAADPLPLIMTIDTATVLHRTGDQYHGTNLTALWNDTGVTEASTKAFATLDLRLVRFPGGVPCQWYDWKTPLDSGWSTTTPELAWSLAQASGASMVFQTNTATKSDGNDEKTGKHYSFDNSAEHQADWVSAAAQAGMKVAWWEIGNEPEMDAPKEHKGNLDHVYAWYNKVYTDQVTAIRARDGKAKILGPASTNTWFWWNQQCLGKFLKAHGNRSGDGLVDGVSLHWYPETDKGDWIKHSGAAQEWAEAMVFIRKTIDENDTRPLPVFISEWSWGGGMNHKGNSGMANALGTADIIGMFERTGVAGHTHFCFQRIDGNWGVVALAKDERPANEPSPAYFALALASRLRGDVLPVNHTANERNDVSAYAARDKQMLRIMLINKQATPRPVQLALTKAMAVSEVTVNELKPVDGSIGATEVILNGVTSPRPLQGSWPAPTKGTWKNGWSGVVPGYGLMLVEILLKP